MIEVVSPIIATSYKINHFLYNLKCLVFQQKIHTLLKEKNNCHYQTSFLENTKEKPLFNMCVCCQLRKKAQLVQTSHIGKNSHMVYSGSKEANEPVEMTFLGHLSLATVDWKLYFTFKVILYWVQSTLHDQINGCKPAAWVPVRPLHSLFTLSLPAAPSPS